MRVPSQFLHFALIGALGFLVDATSLQAFLNIAGLDPYAGRAGSFLVAVTFTWWMNRKFTFHSSDSRLVHEWGRFLAANSLGGAVNLGVYAALVASVDLVASHPVLGVAAGSIAGLAVNFLGSRFFVFRGPEKDVAGGGLIECWRATGWSPRGSEAFGFWVLVAGVLYTVLCLSPSSYGLAFDEMLGRMPGLLLGSPKGLRSDEWAVWTPFIQIAVNNDFARINATSPYLEDLRNFNALPLLDWGLVFKPQFWGFFVLDPAWAYSLYHASIMAAFLIGWERLFRRLGFQRSTAIMATLIAFFFPYTQLWWTTTGSLLAGFPWLLLCFLWETATWKRAAMMAWLGATWMISHLYPPIIISLAFAGMVCLIAFEPRRLVRPKFLGAGLIGSGVGVLLVYLYLAEPISIMARTVYPGERSFDGGGMPILLWLATIFPGLMSFGRETLLEKKNYLEGVSAGCYLTVLCLFFVDWRETWRARRSEHISGDETWWKLAVLGAGLSLLSLWLLLPIPAAVGSVLLWDKVLAARFVFALGVIVLLVNLIWLDRFKLKISPLRFVAATLLIVGMWVTVKIFHDVEVKFRYPEIWAILAMLLFVLVGSRVRVAREHLKILLLTGALAAGVTGYGTYNPLQSSYPMFHRPEARLQSAYEKLERAHPKNYLVTVGGGGNGATLNAWGFRSIKHVLIAPRTLFFRSYFESLNNTEFEFIFNRYAHILLVFLGEFPYMDSRDSIHLPASRFVGGEENSEWVALSNTSAFGEASPLGGNVDSMQLTPDESALVISGWAHMNGWSPDRNLKIYVPGGSEILKAIAVARYDVARAHGFDDRLLKTGFIVKVSLAKGQAMPKFVCVWSRDEDFGPRNLTVKGAPPDRACMAPGR
jgi:putative flippase GtrA